MWEFILDRAGFWTIIGVMMVGLYIAFSAENLIKRLVGLSLFQSTVCLFYVKLGNVDNATAPILLEKDMPKESDFSPIRDAQVPAVADERLADLVHLYSNPLPHVLMLTAIVVGVATLSLGLALIVRISEAYGTTEADDIRAADIANELELEAEAEKELKEAAA